MSKTLEEIQAETAAFVKAAAANYEDSADTKVAMPTETPSSTSHAVSEDARKSDPEAEDLKGGNPNGSETDQLALVNDSDVTDAPSQDKTNKNVGQDGITPGTIAGDCNTPPDTKTGGDVTELGQELLDKLAAATTAEPKKAEDTPKTDEPTATAEEPKKAEDVPAADESPEASKKAGNGIKLDNDLLAKIAESLLATEDGWKIAEEAMAKQAGAEGAASIIAEMSKAAEAEMQMMKVAADQWDQGASDAEALIMKVASIIDQGEAQEQPESADKKAEDAEQAAKADEWEKGAQAAEALLKEGMGGDPAMAMAMEGAEGGELMPEDNLEAPEAMDAANAMAAEDELSPEEALIVLQELIEGGFIDEATAAEIVAQIDGMGGAEGAMPEGAMPAGEVLEGEGDPAAAMAPESPEEGEGVAPDKMAEAEDADAKLAAATSEAVARVLAKRTQEV